MWLSLTGLTELRMMRLLQGWEGGHCRPYSLRFSKIRQQLPIPQTNLPLAYLTENASLNLRVTGSMMKVKIDFLRVTISPVALIPGVNATSCPRT